MLSQSWEGIAWETHINLGFLCVLSLLRWKGSRDIVCSLLSFVAKGLHSLSHESDEKPNAVWESKNLAIFPSKAVQSPPGLWKTLHGFRRAKQLEWNYLKVWSWLRLLNTWKLNFLPFAIAIEGYHFLKTFHNHSLIQLLYI